MEIHIKESTIVRPAEETPKHCLELSELDLLMRAAAIPIVYFYRRPKEDSSNFFEASLMKESLSKVLVPFYPVAGRLRRDANGKIEINCNGEGVLFVEAETSCAIDDLGDFTSTFKLLQFVPTVDYTKEISSCPLLVAQVTHFKCGGVCFGFGLAHTLADATSTFYFIHSWTEMARGIHVSTQPFIDRSLLRVELPNSPKFHHIEYDQPPSMNTSTQSKDCQPNSKSISTVILKLSLDQVNILKEKSKNDHKSYTKFEVLAAHIWRCMCKVRGLSYDQCSKIHIPTNGRSRLNPLVPDEYFGNVVFPSASIALSGDVQSEPLNYTVERIHKALKRMNDEYLKSALAYIKQQPDLMALRGGPHKYKCPNLMISNLLHMPIYDANFGWGGPIFARPLDLTDGVTLILPSPISDGSMYIVTTLQTGHIQLFEKLFYDIFLQRPLCKI